jgi:excisionase family DNA binding protein
MPKTIGDLVLYDVEELSELLGVQDRTIRAYIKDGKLKGRKLAKRWYVTAESLREYFEQPEPEEETELEELDTAWQRPGSLQVDRDTRMARMGPARSANPNDYDSLPK